MQVDLSSTHSINAFVTELQNLELKVNCLILNSGIFSPTYTTIDGTEKTFYVNHLGYELKFIYFELKKTINKIFIFDNSHII